MIKILMTHAEKWSKYSFHLKTLQTASKKHVNSGSEAVGLAGSKEPKESFQLSATLNVYKTTHYRQSKRNRTERVHTKSFGRWMVS